MVLIAMAFLWTSSQIPLYFVRDQILPGRKRLLTSLIVWRH